MPTQTSTAISSQGSTLKVATGTGSAISITAVAEGNPTVLTSAAHGLSNGDVVTISGSTAPAGLNGQFVVMFCTANTFAIALDTTGGASFAGTTTATPVQWTQVGNFKTIKGFDGKTTIIDVTNLSSTAKEKRAGLIDPGQFAFDADIDLSDAGQAAIRAFQVSSSVANYKLTLPNARTATFAALVESTPWDGGVDKVLSTTITLEITGAVTYA